MADFNKIPRADYGANPQKNDRVRILPVDRTSGCFAGIFSVPSFWLRLELSEVSLDLGFYFLFSAA